MNRRINMLKAKKTIYTFHINCNVGRNWRHFGLENFQRLLLLEGKLY